MLPGVYPARNIPKHLKMLTHECRNVEECLRTFDVIEMSVVMNTI